MSKKLSKDLKQNFREMINLQARTDRLDFGIDAHPDMDPERIFPFLHMERYDVF